MSRPAVPAGPSPATNVRWRVLALLFALSFVAYVLRLNLSVAAAQLKPELGLDDVAMGWVFSAFVWGYALFQFPGGLWGERIGPRRALAVCGALWALLTVLTAIVPGVLVAGAGALVALLLLRFAMGVAQAPLFPVLAGSIETWFPVSRWALPNALSNTGLGLGAAATPPVVAWLMVELGWRAAFAVTAPLAAATAWLWWRYARDDPAEHAGTNAAELALIRAERPARTGDVEPGVWRRLVRNRDILLVALSYLCTNYVFYIFFNWAYLYFVEVRGFSILGGGVAAALPWLVGAVVASVGGEVCDRLCRRIGPRWGCRLPGLVALPLVGLFLLAGARVDSPIAAVVLLTLCFSGTQFTEGAYWSATTFVAGRHTAAATGILNTGGNLGGVLSSPLIPLVVSWLGWVHALDTGALFVGIAAVLWLFVRADRPLDGVGPPSRD